MIHRNNSNVQSYKKKSATKANWQQLLADCITDPAELLALLELPAQLLGQAQEAGQLFPLRVTRSFADRMRKGDLHDPLLRQVLPLHEEFTVSADYSSDPLLESNTNKIPGLLHKYKNRVLLTVSGSCAIHCRYCFRRHFPYADNNPGRAGWENVFAYINADANINEVILSGGDPLLASDTMCAYLVERLSQIKQIKRLRIHSRLPIVLPERVTDEMIAWFSKWLSQTGRQAILVIHCNHPNEIDAHVLQAIERLRLANMSLFNQSVLLKGVNDESDCLIKLSEKLFANGILPYYVHLLDKIQGAAHFAVSLEKAKQLHRNLLAELPGYLVPKFVYDAPGATAKISI